MSRSRYASWLRGLGVLSLALCALAGCGGSNGDRASSRVRLILQTTTVAPRLGQQVASGTFDALPRQVQPGDIGFVTNVRITVTGPGIPGSVEETLAVAADQQDRFEGRLRKTVPVGQDRRIHVVASNAGEIVIFRGEKTVDLGQQVEGCEESISLDADSICRVGIELERLAVWGHFRWGEPARWTSRDR